MLQRDAIGALFELSTVVQLRNFLDARVPDGEDDFFFADRVVEALVMGAMEGAGIQDLFAYVREAGPDACCEDEERLPKLITNVVDNSRCPRGENNGWSPQELLERMAGKKVFYNERGDVMKVGRNDPCPCGSGKKYKEVLRKVDAPRGYSLPVQQYVHTFSGSMPMASSMPSSDW